MSDPQDLPFPRSEYQARRDRLRAVLRRRGIHLLLVTSPANLHYLCGYEASWYPPRLPVALGLYADRPTTVFFDWVRHRDHVEQTTLADEAVYYEYGDSAHVIAGALEARGVPPVIALEWSSPTPAPDVINGLAAALEAIGAQLAAGEWIVDDERLYKSPAELEYVRSAARIADEVVRRLQGYLRPGMSELEVSAAASVFLAEGGSEVPAMNPLVSSGPTAWRDVHAFPSRRNLKEGELVSVDVAAVVARYHVNLSRVFCLGTDHPTASAWLAATGRSLDVLIGSARLGESPVRAMEQAEAALRREVPADNIWWTGGYSLGVAFPPSWVGHGYLANDGPTDVVLREGYVSNFESILYDRQLGFEVAAIDSVLMTADGLACLSQIPRELLIVDRNGKQ